MKRLILPIIFLPALLIAMPAGEAQTRNDYNAQQDQSWNRRNLSRYRIARASLDADYSLPRRIWFGFLGVFVDGFAADETFGGGFFGDLVQAGECLARLVGVGLATGPGVSA